MVSGPQYTSRLERMVDMIKCVNNRVNSMEDNVTAITTFLTSLHNSMSEMMMTEVASCTTGNRHMLAGPRAKLDTPRHKYLSVMTERVCDIPRIFTQETLLPGLMALLMGHICDHLVYNTLSPRWLCDVRDRYLFSLKKV